MANFTVFYGAQLYEELEEMPTWYVSELPDGCYILYPSRNWYLKQFNTLTPINICDLSNEVRTYCLIMGITP